MGCGTWCASHRRAWSWPRPITAAREGGVVVAGLSSPSTLCAQSDADHVGAPVMERGVSLSTLWLRCHARPTWVLMAYKTTCQMTVTRIRFGIEFPNVIVVYQMYFKHTKYNPNEHLPSLHQDYDCSTRIFETKPFHWLLLLMGQSDWSCCVIVERQRQT